MADQIDETVTNVETSSLAPIDLLRESWPSLSSEKRLEEFRALALEDREDLFLSLSSNDQSYLLSDMRPSERRLWIRILPPDDVADVIQHVPPEDRPALLALLIPRTRREVEALLAYAEDDAGGLMSPRFIRIRPDVTVDVAIRYLRAQARQELEAYQYAYVLNSEQRLLGVISFRQLLLAPSDRQVREVMTTDTITLPEDMDQEEVGRRFMESGLAAIPVTDAEGHMKGIVTVDDVVDVVQEEATEDIQKIGGSEAFDEPYPQIRFAKMIQKRAGWLTVLFLGEMFTATAMAYFEREIERAVVLALFIPLIISSGGNSGSQAASLIIRSLALRELNLRDWWKVFLRELSSGLALGTILGSIGFLRILLWPQREALYGEHYVLLGLTVAVSLVGVVLWGSLTGSMLPFLLRWLRFDPATASAPFVATLVDVTGLVIYFTAASVFLSGTLL
ncbi:MAG: magnesium transporter [Bdellovibrionales bacterium]